MSIVLMGSTSGSCTLQEQAVAGTTTLTLPTFNGTVGLLVSGTAVASTSGTSIDFTGIPAGVRRITVMLNEVSTSGTSDFLIQLGDSGGIETTGYLSTSSRFATGVTTTANTNGFGLASVATDVKAGHIVLTNISGNIWIASGTVKRATDSFAVVAGSKTLSDVLNQVRITNANGTDTFDAGSINILYE